MLRGKKPESKEKRLKLFMYGPAGVGKTFASLQFPNAYIIDTERGTDYYDQAIVANDSVVFQSVNPDDIREEIKELLTTPHPYKTLIIDPITQVYNSIQEKWTRIFEKNAKSENKAEVQDFGMRYWGKVKSEMKSLQRMLLALDMNVIITSHQKDVYGTNFNKIGVTYDSMRGDDYLFDLIFQIEKRGSERTARTIKERAEVGKNKFPEEFEWSYSNFLKFYGKNAIERAAVPLSLASPDQVDRLEKLIDLVNLPLETISKWFTKTDVDKFEEMTSEQIQKCIDFVESKLQVVGGTK
jgi:hypothetical protein